MNRTLQIIDYVATQEDAVLTYSRIQMTLASHSNACYLNEPEAHIWSDGHFLLSNNTTFPPKNGAILTIAKIIKNVISSAAKAELGNLYISAREVVYIRIILKELGHKQPRTPK